MADRPPYPNTGEATRTSRWQKVVGIIGLVVLALAVGILLVRLSLGGDHNPSTGTQGGNQQQQTGTDGGGEHTPPPWVPEGHR